MSRTDSVGSKSAARELETNFGKSCVAKSITAEKTLGKISMVEICQMSSHCICNGSILSSRQCHSWCGEMMGMTYGKGEPIR